jgi:hypothetical protein
MTTEESLQKLPTDHRVVQLMDFVRHTDRYTVTFCSKHHLQPLNFFCEPCVKPVCRDCTVLDHKEANGHLVMDLEEVQESRAWLRYSCFLYYILFFLDLFVDSL